MAKIKKKSKKNLFSLKTLFIFLFLAILILFGVGYYFVNTGKIVYVEDKKVQKNDELLLKQIQQMLQEQKKQIKADLEKINKEKLNKNKKLHVNEEIKNEKKKEVKPQKNTEKNIKKDENQAKKQVVIKKETKLFVKNKPKLAIIVDDVSFNAHVNSMKKVPYKITPSILPPTKAHPNTPDLAKKFSVYMVHLPLEALSHAHPEPRTLKKGESFQSINEWIKTIKQNFPHATYYNNHTGSKFTSDLKSMDKLFKSFKQNGIKFLDSKTTPNSKASQVAKKYGIKVLYRDVFLDNSFDPKSIKKQLKYAVKVAKQNGYAIAICHPHASTMKVLQNAQEILKDVQMVYVSEL